MASLNVMQGLIASSGFGEDSIMLETVHCSGVEITKAKEFAKVLTALRP